jgi:hypothetical protein
VAVITCVSRVWPRPCLFDSRSSAINLTVRRHDVPLYLSLYPFSADQSQISCRIDYEYKVGVRHTDTL